MIPRIVTVGILLSKVVPSHNVPQIVIVVILPSKIITSNVILQIVTVAVLPSKIIIDHIIPLTIFSVNLITFNNFPKSTKAIIN